MAPQIQEATHFYYWIEDGILNVVHKPDLVITLDVAREMIIERNKINQDKNMPILLDIRELTSIDTLSRKYFTTEESVQNLIAGALLVDSLVSKLAANLFIKVNKPPIPTKLFTNRAKAIAWLKKYVK